VVEVRAQRAAMTRAAGDYHVVGYGENVNVPTIDLISAEKNVIGNLVGSYNDLCDLMALAARGLVTLHTQKYALDDFQSRDLGSRRRPRARSRDPHPLRARRDELISFLRGNRGERTGRRRECLLTGGGPAILIPGSQQEFG